MYIYTYIPWLFEHIPRTGLKGETDSFFFCPSWLRSCQIIADFHVPKLRKRKSSWHLHPSCPCLSFEFFFLDTWCYSGEASSVSPMWKHFSLCPHTWSPALWPPTTVVTHVLQLLGAATTIAAWGAEWSFTPGFPLSSCLNRTKLYQHMPVLYWPKYFNQKSASPRAIDPTIDTVPLTLSCLLSVTTFLPQGISLIWGVKIYFNINK